MVAELKKLRLFVAVALADEVRHGLAAHLGDALDGRPLPGRPVPPDNWHITLRFLGYATEDVRDVVTAALDEAEAGGPFRLRFGGLGAFPRPARATVLWLGIEEGAERLGEVAAAVEEAVVGCGFLQEERPFHAHLTLSRIRPHQDVRPTIDRVPPFPLRQPVTEFVLFRSTLGGGPARYEPVERFPLA